MLDTNIYGLLIADNELLKIKVEYEKIRNEYPIYGLSLIRKELRATPKGKKHLNKNLRVAMLSLYDTFVGKHDLVVNEKDLLKIAKQYFKIYKDLGGGYGQKEMLNDFVIVAGAAEKDLDVVVSHDNGTMLSEIALKSYEIVNKKLGLKNPEFYDYLDFKDLFRWPPV